MYLEHFISIFTVFAGFIIGLGAVTVIDLHGFLGQNSGYWTEATIRSHKITKPLIWVGMTLVLFGLSAMFFNFGQPDYAPLQLAIVIIMILNGLFLSFYISPKLLKLEEKGIASKILPSAMQQKIFVSFILSFISWWSSVALTVLFISNLIVL